MYKNYAIFLQLISFKAIENKNLIINYRFKFFPKEKNTAYNQVRLNWYKNCNKLIILDKEIDLIDKIICKVINWTSEKKDLIEIEKNNFNLQYLSDKANFYHILFKKDKKNIDIKKHYEKKKEIWKIILKYDKNFVNWYLILANYYFDYKNNCKDTTKILKLLEKNYIWDENKIDNYFEKYKKCNIESEYSKTNKIINIFIKTKNNKQLNKILVKINRINKKNFSKKIQYFLEILEIEIKEKINSDKILKLSEEWRKDKIR